MPPAFSAFFSISLFVSSLFFFCPSVLLLFFFPFLASHQSFSSNIGSLLSFLLFHCLSLPFLHNPLLSFRSLCLLSYHIISYHIKSFPIPSFASSAILSDPIPSYPFLSFASSPILNYPFLSFASFPIPPYSILCLLSCSLFLSRFPSSPFLLLPFLSSSPALCIAFSSRFALFCFALLSFLFFCVFLLSFVPFPSQLLSVPFTSFSSCPFLSCPFLLSYIQPFILSFPLLFRFHPYPILSFASCLLCLFSVLPLLRHITIFIQFWFLTLFPSILLSFLPSFFLSYPFLSFPFSLFLSYLIISFASCLVLFYLVFLRHLLSYCYCSSPLLLLSILLCFALYFVFCVFLLSFVPFSSNFFSILFNSFFPCPVLSSPFHSFSYLLYFAFYYFFFSSVPFPLLS